MQFVLEKLEHKVFWKAINIALERLVKDFDRHRVELGEVLAQEYLFLAAKKSAVLYFRKSAWFSTC